MRKRTVLLTKVKENVKEVISMFRNKKKILVVLQLLISATLLVGFAGQPVWGSPSLPVWYYGELVPFGELLAEGIEPHCHDGLGPGIITCYDTNEELAAATGLDLRGADKAAVQHLRSTGAVPEILCDYYSIVWQDINYGGRNFALCYDYNDFRTINFNDITSSIEIPSGAGYSTYFQHVNFGGDKRSFNSNVSDLRDYDFNDVISSSIEGLP